MPQDNRLKGYASQAQRPNPARVPFKEGFAPAVTTDDLLGTGQQTITERILGIEKGAPLDMPSFGEMVRGIGGGAKQAWQGLAKASLPPRYEPPMPDGGVPSFEAVPNGITKPPTSAPSRLGPGQFKGLGEDRFEVAGAFGGPSVTGTASFGGGPLDTEQALAGLKAASSQFGGGFRRPTEELYKQAFRPAEQMAPGAGQMALAELESRVGAEEFARLLGQKQEETIQTAQTGLHPAVQAQQEATAKRATYPAQAAGQASALAGMFGLQREQVRGQASVEAARARRDAQAGQAVTRAMSELAVGPQDESDDDRALRLNLMQRLDAMEKALRSGEYFLSDYADIDPIAAGIMENYIDEIEGQDVTSSGF